MKVTVVGCGRWGTFIAWYLDSIGHEVVLYGRESSPHMERLRATRKNELLTLPGSIALTASLEEIGKADAVVVSIPSQGLRKFLKEIKGRLVAGKPLVLCMKGLETGTGRRLTEVAGEVLEELCPVAVWLGPGHVQEFCRGIPNCMVIDSRNQEIKERLVKEFSSELIRFYYGQDLIGNEVGAAAKNVIGIAAGMLDGLNLPTLKGALMSRGTREISRLIEAMGGSAFSAYGLCHLGDYQATVVSPYSHNRRYGESFVKGEPYGELAEGYYTVSSLMTLREQYGVELPICTAVYHVLYEGAEPRRALDSLFQRSLKNEF